MGAVKNVLIGIVESVERELGCCWETAWETVDDLTRQGVELEDLFDVIVDGWTVEQYRAEYGVTL